MNNIEPIDLQSETEDHLPSHGLLSFYDRLRASVTGAIDRRGDKWASGVTSALLLVPDTFMLLARLSLDRDVPKATRTLMASTLAYFVMPVDFMPEAVLGPTGYLDDLVLGLTAVAQAFDKDLEYIAEKHWNGSQSLRAVMRDVLGAANSLLGTDLNQRLRKALSKRGMGV